jgi:hypothetical protein
MAPLACSAECLHSLKELVDVLSQLQRQIIELAESVGKMKPDSPVQWQVGKIANVLIEESQKKAPDSPVLKVIEPFRARGRFIADETAGSVRAIMRQVAEALPSEGPAIA